MACSYVQSLEKRLGQLECLIPQDVRSQPDVYFLQGGNLGDIENGRHSQEGSRQDVPSQTSVADISQDTTGVHSQQTSTTFRIAPLRTETLSQSNETSQTIGTSPSAMPIYNNRTSPAQTHHSQSTHASVSQASGSPSSSTFQPNNTSRPIIRRDSNITGVMSSLPRHHNHEPGSASLEHFLNHLAIWPDSIPAQVEDHLINVYFNKANRRWPFLLQESFSSWHACWKRNLSERYHRDLWQGFFVNMVISTSREVVYVANMKSSSLSAYSLARKILSAHPTRRR